MVVVTTTPSMATGVTLTTTMATIVRAGMVDLAGGMDGMDFILPSITLPFIIDTEATTMDTETIITIDHIMTKYPITEAEEIVTTEDVLQLRQVDDLAVITPV